MFSKKHKVSATAVIVAAGSSSRMGSGVNKQFLLIDQAPVLAHTLMRFDKAETISDIIIVTKPENILTVQDMVKEFGIIKVRDIVPGGNTRQESVRCGLSFVKESPLVAVHDGARPFISSQKIDELVRYAEKHGAVAPGIIPKDTVKLITDDGIVSDTPARASLRLIQTPQVFPTDILKTAHSYALDTGFEGTDDCSVAEASGVVVHIIDGETTNIKVTTPDDLPVAESIYSFLRGN